MENRFCDLLQVFQMLAPAVGQRYLTVDPRYLTVDPRYIVP